MTSDIDTLARTIALEHGIGPLTWSAMDECERLYYRREAAKLHSADGALSSPQKDTSD
jgi:hypothetical protein